MVLVAKTKIYKHALGNTLYLGIPAKITQDSAFPFNPGEIVEIQININKNELIIKKYKV